MCGSSRPLSNPVESASGIVESDELLVQQRSYFVALGDNNNDSLLSCVFGLAWIVFSGVLFVFDLNPCRMGSDAIH